MSVDHGSTRPDSPADSPALTGGSRPAGDHGPETIFRLGAGGRRRYRTLFLTAALVGVAATLPVLATDRAVQWPAVAASLAGFAVLSAVSARAGRVERLLLQVGPFVCAGLILVLVLATGGTSSPYEVLYVPLVGFAAAFRDRRMFLAVLGVSASAALLPTLLDPEADRLVIEVLVLGAVALTLVVVQRIAAGLRDANGLYLSVLENHAGPTYLLAPDGTLQWINRPGEEVLGLPLDRVVGLPWPSVVAEGEAERLMPTFLAAMAGEPQEITFRTDAPGGSYLLGGTIFPVKRDGRNVAVMGITHDVTQLHEAAFGAEALRWVLDSLTIPVAIFDVATHAPLYANDAAGQLLEEAAPDGTWSMAWDRLRPSLVEALPEPGGSRQVTLELDGTVDHRQLDVAIERLQGDQELVVYTAVDVSERGRRERELERIAELERETVQRLREVDRVKNAFLTAVSHELRTPATVILGASLSLQKLHVSDEGARAQLEDALVRNARRLEQLLTDLLDLGRLTQGRTRAQPAPFDLVQLLGAVVDRDPQSERISLEAPRRLPVRSDRVQVERILENLLGNAAKYAPGAAVTVALRAREDGGFRLTVTDAGPGIPEEDLERVFEPFHRVDLDHPQPGTGIGLALVAEFAAIHGGHARAERVGPGGGTRIVVDIPERRDL